MDKLLAFVLNEWLNDIKKNQLPSVLGGVGPMHSFVQLCTSNDAASHSSHLPLFSSSIARCVATNAVQFAYPAWGTK